MFRWNLPRFEFSMLGQSQTALVTWLIMGQVHLHRVQMSSSYTTRTTNQTSLTMDDHMRSVLLSNSSIKVSARSLHDCILSPTTRLAQWRQSPASQPGVCNSIRTKLVVRWAEWLLGGEKSGCIRGKGEVRREMRRMGRMDGLAMTWEVEEHDHKSVKHMSEYEMVIFIRSSRGVGTEPHHIFVWNGTFDRTTRIFSNS